MRVLILGGTTEARELHQALGDRAVLALKRTTSFGGADGLARYVRENEITHIVDATHPFATRISANAAGTPAELIRLERPPYAPQPNFTYIAHLREAAIPAHARVLLTTGHHELEHLRDHSAFFLIRALNPPAKPLPRHHELLLAKGPFSLQSELDLIRTQRLTHLVTKDSGGPDAKLRAAAQAGLPVIVIERPRTARPPLTVTSVAEVLALLSAAR
jgi:precorrin-6A/cobalt-precorrin-6A reductase